MPFQPAPDCAEVILRGTYGGKDIANVLNFAKAGGYGQTDIDNLGDAVATAASNLYLPELSDNVTLAGALVRGLANIVDFTYTSVAIGTGALSTTSLPANVSLCITLRTGLTGRSARGRFYAMPTAAANEDATNTFIADYGDDLVDFLNNVKTLAAAQNWTLVILSRFTNGVRRASAVYHPVVSIGYRNLIMDSMRHRLPKGH